MFYRAVHTTEYVYAEPVSHCQSEAWLTPRGSMRQTTIETSVRVLPAPAYLRTRLDYFGNVVTRFEVREPHTRLAVTAASVVEVESRPAVTAPSPPWEDARAILASAETEETLGAFEFCCESPFVTIAPELAAYGAGSFTPGRPVFEAARHLMERIHREFKYEPKSTTIDTTVIEVMRNRKGVCQDFSHVMIGALRSLGLAARYVSGYLRSGANYQGAEASHAWVSVFIPGAGWIDFDPTNNVIPADGHLTLAYGRDYGDVTPLKGVTLGGGEHTVSVEVRVRPLAEAGSPAAEAVPRPAKNQAQG